MNVTAGSEFASVESMLWTNSSNVTFTELARLTLVDFEINEINSTVATFVDTVPTQEIEFPEVAYDLKWLDPLDLFIKGFFIILAILMAMYMVEKKWSPMFGCALVAI